MKIVELSEQSKAQYMFKHYVSTDKTESNDVALFHQWRSWCWQVWGPSGELSKVINWRNSKIFDKITWCWDTDFNNLHIYFSDDAQLSAFLLQWQEH